MAGRHAPPPAIDPGEPAPESSTSPSFICSPSTQIRSMLAAKQPNAMAFNGCVVKGGAAQNKSTCITPNSLRWIGS